MDFYDIKTQITQSPTLKLLKSRIASLVLGFLYQEFKENHRTSVSESELEAHLENYLEEFISNSEDDQEENLNQEEKGYKSPKNYLTEWCNNQWLARVYETNEYIFKLTSYSEKAILWMEELEDKGGFIPTESRFAQIWYLLKDIYNYSNTDAETRIRILEEDKAKIQEEIDKIQQTGEVIIFNPTRLKERFILANSLMRQLLSEFSKIEENFNQLAKEIHYNYLQDNVSKGVVLGKVIDRYKALDETEQGRSFKAFFDFLNLEMYQRDLETFIETIYSLEELQDLTENDQQLKQIKRRLMTSADPILKLNHNITAKLSQILQEKNLREYRRISELIKEIKKLTLQVIDNPPDDDNFFYLEGDPNISFSIDRPLYSLESSESFIMGTDFSSLSKTLPDADILKEIYSNFEVDEEKLKEQIKTLLKDREEITLQELTNYYPIKQGLAEIVAYLSIATEFDHHGVDSSIIESMVIECTDSECFLQVTLPQIIFRR